MNKKKFKIIFFKKTIKIIIYWIDLNYLVFYVMRLL